MCTHRKIIKNSRGRDIVVNCGHCPACLQEKAIKRANRIRAHQPADGSLIALFVTLTYRNSCIPYFDLDEFNAQKPFRLHHETLCEDIVCSDNIESNLFKFVNIKRMKSVRWIRRTRDYKMRRSSKFNPVELSSVRVKYDPENPPYFKTLKNCKHNYVGVCYYKDFQDFMKRLRRRLSYHGYHSPLSYYCCSEYGPTTMRPHFHALVFCKTEDYEIIADAIASSWSFDDYHRTRKYIEVAKNAADYVAAYVNCSSSVPPVLRDTREISPSHSYSQGFGMAYESFTLAEVAEAIRCGNLRYNRTRFQDGAFIVEPCVFPKYVISRYFPKFKGFNRLTFDEVVSVCLRPETLERYAPSLFMTKEQCRQTKVTLRHKWNAAKSVIPDKYEWAEMYAKVWTSFASAVLSDFYFDSLTSLTANFYAYDNIADFYLGNIPSNLMDISRWIPENPIIDFNAFPSIVARSEYLEGLYHSYSKDRKINNFILSNYMNI